MDPRALNDKGKRPLGVGSEEDMPMRIRFVENNLQGLERCRNSLSKKEKESLFTDYHNVDALMDLVEDREAIRAFLKFFDPDTRCFVFPKVDLTPTLEEYHHVLDLYTYSPHNTPVYVPDLSKDYSKAAAGLKDQLENSFGVMNVWAKESVRTPNGYPVINWDQIYQKMEMEDKKNNGKERNDRASRRRVAFFMLGVYGLILFPFTKDRVDARVVDMMLSSSGKDMMHMALAETLRTCVHLKTHHGGQFRGCTQLFTLWIHGRFSARENWNYGNLKFQGAEFIKKFNKPNRKEMNRIQWEDFLSALEAREVTWEFPWKRSIEFYVAPSAKYQCVPLFGLYGAISYSPAMVMRQLQCEQGKPKLGGINTWNVEYDGQAPTIAIVEEMKEAWGQCEKKRTRLGQGFTKEHRAWRNEWVDHRVMPKKPRDSIFYRYTLSEEVVKEKEQTITDLEEKMGKLQYQLYENRMVGSELERVQKEYELACQDRDSWKGRELKSEADIWQLKTKDRSFNVHLKEKSVLADKLIRTVPKQYQYIKQLEAKCEGLRENEEIWQGNVEWLQKKRRELEAELKQVTEERDQMRASTDCHIERDQFFTSERARYEKEIDMLKLANRMQALRREASEDCKNDPILNMKGFSSAIEQDDEVRAILRRQEGLAPYVDEVIGYLAGRLAWVDILGDTEGFWLDAEKRIADLDKSNKEFHA